MHMCSYTPLDVGSIVHLKSSDISNKTRFDLHIHTNASDGKFNLDEVLTRCARSGLDVVAITDHDFATPIEPGSRTIEGKKLHVIPGAELSGLHKGQEFHLLVYFPTGVPSGFREFCQLRCDERTQRFEQALRALGLPESPQRTEQALTRLHLAHTLVDAGWAKSRSEAFGKYLNHSLGLVPKLSLPFVDAIKIARRFGGITSWAHPPRDAVERFLPTFVDAGLQGLEGVRAQLRSADRRFFRKRASRHRLFLTGGSDWHGWRSESPGLFRVQPQDIQDFLDVLLAA